VSIIVPHRRKAFQPAGGDASLILHLPIDEGSGSTTTDAIEAVNWTLGSGASWSGAGILLDGSNNGYFENAANSHAGLAALDTAFTVFYRVMPTITAGSPPYYHVSYGDAWHAPTFYIDHKVVDADFNSITVSSWVNGTVDTRAWTGSTADFNYGANHTFAYCWDGTEHYTVVDGTELARWTHNGSGNLSQPGTSRRWLTLGAARTFDAIGDSVQANTRIDEVMIFNVAKTAAEIAAL